MGVYCLEFPGFSVFYAIKRPYAHLATDTGVRVVRQRLALEQPTEPIVLFFDFLKKQESHLHSQHNLLYRLNAWSQGNARYVCPLTMTRRAYLERVHAAGVDYWRRFSTSRGPSFAWSTQPSTFHELGNPILLAHHLSIEPHAEVDDTTHSYSFTSEGTHLCFHSPEAVPGGFALFSDWMDEMTLDFLKPVRRFDPSLNLQIGFNQRFEKEIPLKLPMHKRWITQKEAGQRLLELLKYLDWQDRFNSSKFILEDGMSSWLWFGDLLRKEYGIELYGFVQRSSASF